MIQRIQTLYLAIAIILLSIVTVGTSFFSFLNETSRYVFSSWGMTELSGIDHKVVSTQNFPFFIATLALVLLCFFCLMSYKKLNLQLKVGRIVFYLYFLEIIALVILSMYGESIFDLEATSREMGLGYYLFIAGFPFVILSNIGIKRDKRLLESLDRLR